MTTDSFDVPMTDEERCEVAAMPTHEIYLLTVMVPHGTTRAREVREIYRAALDVEIELHREYADA